MEKKREKTARIVKKLKELFPDPKTTLVYKNPLEVVVAIILSARNTDQKVNPEPTTLRSGHWGISLTRFIR